MLERRFAQFLAVVLEVGVIRKAGLPIIAALDDVLREAGQVDSGRSGHWLGRLDQGPTMLRAG